MTRAIPGARPAAVQAGYPARLSNQGSNRAVRHRIKQKTDPEVGFSNLAVREGFEPSIRCRIHTFQACSFSHSDTSPNFYFFEVAFGARKRASCRLRRWAATRTPHPILVCALTCSANTNSLRRCAGTGRNVRDRREAVNAIFYLLPLFAQ